MRPVAVTAICCGYDSNSGGLLKSEMFAKVIPHCSRSNAFYTNDLQKAKGFSTTHLLILAACCKEIIKNSTQRVFCSFMGALHIQMKSAGDAFMALKLHMLGATLAFIVGAQKNIVFGPAH